MSCDTFYVTSDFVGINDYFNKNYYFNIDINYVDLLRRKYSDIYLGK